MNKFRNYKYSYFIIYISLAFALIGFIDLYFSSEKLWLLSGLSIISVFLLICFDLDSILNRYILSRLSHSFLQILLYLNMAIYFMTSSYGLVLFLFNTNLINNSIFYFPSIILIFLFLANSLGIHHYSHKITKK